MHAHRNGDGPDGRDAPDQADPVARNRAAHPRRTPGRPELGGDVVRRVTIAAMVVVAGATVVLIAILSSTS